MLVVIVAPNGDEIVSGILTVPATVPVTFPSPTGVSLPSEKSTTKNLKSLAVATVGPFPI